MEGYRTEDHGEIKRGGGSRVARERYLGTSYDSTESYATSGSQWDRRGQGSDSQRDMVLITGFRRAGWHLGRAASRCRGAGAKLLKRDSRWWEPAHETPGVRIRHTEAEDINTCSARFHLQTERVGGSMGGSMGGGRHGLHKAKVRPAVEVQ